MAHQLLSGELIDPSSVILSLEFTAGLSKNELLDCNPSLVGRAVDDPDGDDDPLLVVLSFSNLPRLGDSFVLGSSITSDIRIGVPGYRLSAQHLRFGFNQHGGVIMTDASTLGTAVSYGSQQPQTRRGTLAQPYSWVIPSGYDVHVKIPPFTFTVRTPDHSTHLDEFRANLDTFRAACSAQMPPVSNMNLAQSVAATASNLTPASPAGDAAGTATLNPGTTSSDDELLSSEMYVEGRVIGQGGNGRVSEFFAVRDWTKYAGKRVYYDTKMLDEIEMLKKLSHSHIVRYIDTFEELPTSNVLVMEYCNDSTLWHQHHRQPFQQGELYVVLRQSTAGVSYLHREGVTHRDIKPENILFRSRSPHIEVAVADFGWARESVTSMSSFCAGTVHYRAPEVVAHQRYRNPVDVWALGVIGLEYLEGLPDEGSTTEAEYARLVSEHAGRLARRQPGNRHRLLLSQMLRVDAAERPSAERCLEVLGSLVAGAVEPRKTAATATAGLGVAADSQATVRGPGSSRPEDLDSAKLEAYIALGNGSSVAPPRTAVRKGPSEESDGHEESSSDGDDADDDTEYNHTHNEPAPTRKFKRSAAPPPSSSPDPKSVPRQGRVDADVDADANRSRRSGAPPPPPTARKRDAASGSGSSGPARRASKRLATAAAVREEASRSEQEAARLLLALNK